ncbi:ferrous iron transport protein B [Blattabacterium cuenoti]|uniref:ferrous iron transport protein B n=1 Tax=Blattabacterium cuenoti TaxID=1653831 RepID=UPI00163CACC0|nr:ferrous iron transport protein B [Blattabacterium cuenoti]
MQGRLIKLALLGNPNVGKTSLFNKLTGLNQKIGNYLGVTVEKKIGFFCDQKISYQIIDLPGIYSIYPSSENEEIISTFLLNQKIKDHPDYILFVVDASNIKKSLLLFRQVQDLGFSMFIVINMLDEAKKKGIYINIKKLEIIVNTKITLINARNGDGIQEMKNQLKILIQKKIRSLRIKSLSFSIKKQYFHAIQEVKNHFHIKNPYEAWYHLACDKKFVKQNPLLKEIRKKYKIISKRLQVKEILDRYEEIGNIYSKTVSEFISEKTKNRLEFLKKLDKSLILHPFLGYIVFFFLLFFVFQLIFFWSEFPVRFIKFFFSYIQQNVENIYTGPLSNFFLQGFLPGINTIISFIPQIFILLFFLLLMEESGYISRVIFLMDKIMRPFGLNGKSIVPLISAISCSIPAIISSRHIENYRDRLITILVTPFMTCSAKLPIYTIIISLIIPNIKWGFFQLRGIILMMMYILGVITSLCVAMIFHKYLKKSYDSHLIMEIPTYKIPVLKNIFISLWLHIKSFILNTGKIILLINVLIWVLGTFGPSENNFFKKNHSFLYPINIEERKLENSYLGLFGKKIEPIISPLGYDWKIGIGLLSSFVAREVFVSTMNSLYKIEGPKNINKNEMHKNIYNNKFVCNVPTGVSLLFFYAFSMQCMSTVSIMRKETKSWKWPITQFVLMTLLAYVFSFISYQILIKFMDHHGNISL